MKILFLLPPSEGKTNGGIISGETLSFQFEKPKAIAGSVTEKDLKCTGDRYEEGVQLNQQLLSMTQGEVKSAIERYSGVMYNAIDYAGMTDEGKQFFNEHFVIFSGMYGKVKPMDNIGNYKLPIETKGLAKYWQENITQSLNESGVDYVVNLLPLSYMKMINFKSLQPKIVHINFLTHKNGKIVKISHGVKKIKGEWIKNVCEKLGSNDNLDLFKIFGGEKIETDTSIDINIFNH